MPADFTYNFLGFAGPCAVGPGAPLTGIPASISLTWPQLLNAQLRLGVYPVGWVNDELIWRTISFVISCSPLAAVGGLPGAVPPLFVAPGVPAAGGAANVPVSPVALGVDATERGQLGYHMGTGVGGSLAEYLAINAAAAAPTTHWYPFHLSRAQTNGGVFNFATAQRPDIVIYSVDTGGGAVFVWDFVVWENKGHCVNFGGAAAIAPALVQAQSLTGMTVIPGNPTLGIAGGTPVGGVWPPDCHIASQVDLLGGNFRVQTVDPIGSSPKRHQFSPKGSDDFLRGYFSPFIEAVTRGPQPRERIYNKRKFRMIELPKEVKFGIDDEIVKAWLRKGPSGTFSKEVNSILAEGFKIDSPNTLYIHETGIAVEISNRWYPWPRAGKER